MKSLQLKRKRQVFVSDSSRVIVKYYAHGDEKRIQKMLNRICSLTPSQIKTSLNETFSDFFTRHHDLKSMLLNNFNIIQHLVPPNKVISDELKLLIGAYFTHEYSIESAALFNPSIIHYPSKNNLDKNSIRVILSFRATGEGHISSIVFRSGILDSHNNFIMDPVTPYVEMPKLNFDPEYHRHTFLLKLEELGAINDVSKRILMPLPEFFLRRDLKTSIENEKSNYKNSLIQKRTIEIIQLIVQSNYDVTFRKSTKLCERVLFPVAMDERNGIEDARFVRFQNDNKEFIYYATYTAFNGFNILPMLMETKDFISFKMRTLNGSAIENKGMALFPKKISGQYYMIGRQDGVNLYIMKSNNLHFWNNKKLLLSPKYDWELLQVGNCGSPIETEKGWLLLTHGVGPLRKYCIGAILLDLKTPGKIIGRLSKPLITPIEIDREGYVPNVVYTCGSIVHNKELIIPYAVSDTSTGISSLNLENLLDKLVASGI